MAKQLKPKVTASNAAPASPKPWVNVIKARESNISAGLTGDSEHPSQVFRAEMPKSFQELLKLLEKPENDIEATVVCWNESAGKLGIRKLDKKEFLEAATKPNEVLKSQKLGEAIAGMRTGKRMRESVDAFATDANFQGGLVGSEFVPVLGGPFFKQLYPQDFMRQANAAFWAWNHDPIAHQSVNILRDFTLGRGFRVDSDNASALALWRAFEKVNRIQEMLQSVATELCVNGEVMTWKLPDQMSQLVQVPSAGQPIPKGIIPRVRLIDTTNIYDIVTWPEDITRPLFYVWMAPTQWQTFTGPTDGGGQTVPGTKFIYQTIPADQMNHYKINSFSNEKRGRSDLFPILGFLKRLRDSVEYSIIGLQKQSAYCIDTTIEGDDGDISNYIAQQQSLGTIHPAGSEFVHTKAVTRKYEGADSAQIGASPAFEWCFSMCASGFGLPMSYYGTHISGGATRAGAVVATEPVTKRFEMRQQVYESIIHDLWDYVQDWAGEGYSGAECEVTFPEIITADKSQKFKDLALVQAEGWISKERAATIAAKELNIADYEYDEEKADIDADPQANLAQGEDLGVMPPNPLSNIPGVDPGQNSGDNQGANNALPSKDKQDLKKDYVS